MSQISSRGVILCGGVATRLWPLSSASLPRQFIDLGAGVSLPGDTLSRLDLCDGFIAFGLG